MKLSLLHLTITYVVTWNKLGITHSNFVFMLAWMIKWTNGQNHITTFFKLSRASTIQSIHLLYHLMTWVLRVIVIIDDLFSNGWKYYAKVIGWVMLIFCIPELKRNKNDKFF